MTSSHQTITSFSNHCLFTIHIRFGVVIRITKSCPGVPFEQPCTFGELPENVQEKVIEVTEDEI